MNLAGRWPLAVGVLVLAAVYYVLSLLFGGTCAVALLTIVFFAASAVALKIGSSYQSEDWKIRREAIRIRTASKTDAPVSQKSNIKYSVVAPCYNEEERIDKMIKETADYFKKSKETWELVCLYMIILF